MKLETLKGVGSGQTIVFVGNGTTLNEFDLAKIAHPIAASNFYIPFGPAKWERPPDWFFAHDPSVLFVPWEAHRAFKRLPAPPGYDPTLPSPAAFIDQNRQWFRRRLILQSSLDWWGGFGVKAVMRGVDQAGCSRWLESWKSNAFTYDPVLPSGHDWTARIRRRMAGGYKQTDFDPRGYAWNPRLWERLLAPVGPGLMRDLARSRVPLWGLNSFTTVMLPILLLMGWQRIVLVGVDYDKEGYFFNPYHSGTGQRFFYREEYDEFYWLCDLARRLPHRPLIQAVHASRNLLRPPGGLVEFEEVCR